MRLYDIGNVAEKSSQTFESASLVVDLSEKPGTLTFWFQNYCSAVGAIRTSQNSFYP